MWKGSGWMVYVVGLSLVGCLGGPRSNTPVYAVSWNDEAHCGGIHISAASELSFSKDVIQVNRHDVAALDIHLTVANHSGQELFVAALDENPWLSVHWTTRSVNDAGEVETREGHSSGLGGVGPGVFRRLCPWPAGQKQVAYDRPLLYDVRVRIPLNQEHDTRYTDIEIEFPLHYYALGATEPARIIVRRAMRVEYRD